jgi:endonuclease/exonuclease/phosphatase (EEP) superfamily protein YafD
MNVAARRAVAGYLGVALLVTMGGHAASAAVGPAPFAAKAKNVSQVRVATYNTSSQVSLGQAVADVARLADEADIVTLQEMSSLKRRNAVRASLVDCSMCPFEAHIPQEAVQGGTPILYRWDKFRVEASGTTKVSDATYVGPKGAGPSTLRAKYVNWVQLRDRVTGRDVYVLNNHAVPSVQAKGGAPNRKMKARLKLYRQHMAGLRTLISEFRSGGGVVFVTGDLNVNFRTDRKVQAKMFPYSQMKALGLRASFDSLGQPSGGTHVLRSGFATRLIDYVYASTSAPGVTPVNQRILYGYSSDHRPVVATYQLSPR